MLFALPHQAGHYIKHLTRFSLFLVWLNCMFVQVLLDQKSGLSIALGSAFLAIARLLDNDQRPFISTSMG